MNKLNKKVFFPPIILLISTVIFCLVNNSLFSSLVTNLNAWVLKYFGFLFSWSSFLFLVLLLITYFSPIAHYKIGGKNATPLLTKPRWLAISICTTVATGILFWGCAEPLTHYGQPPLAGVAPFSEASMQFAMSTMFMHWSFTPYAIYCVTGLVFALAFYNMKQKFSVSAVFGIPANRQNTTINTLTDIICLYALVLGMSASLGAGIYSLIGGLEDLFGIQKSNLWIGIVGGIIIFSFILSAVSGLQRGIKWLSTINIIGFVLIAIFVFVLGFPSQILGVAVDGLKEYVVEFIPRSLNLDDSIDQQWMNDWSIFYWANWFAWAPISSLFLGKIARGYTVRMYINFNLIIPALFAIVWMTIFSGSTLYLDSILEHDLYQEMNSVGIESVMYNVFEQLPSSTFTVPVILFLIFLSYVTAADSNISAMAALSEDILAEDDSATASIQTKVIWGLVIGSLTYIMLSTQGVDGIRILSVLGGFPALFIVIAAALTLIRMLFNKDLIDKY